MAMEMASPLTPFPFPTDKEHEIVDEFQLFDKPLYIRSKESEIHVGTKIVLEIQNKNDIEEFKPLIKSLSQSSDLSTNNTITEVKEKQSVYKKLSKSDNNQMKNDIISHSQNSSNNVGLLSVDSSISLDKPVSASSNDVDSENTFLLPPDYFQSISKQPENFKATNSYSKYPLKKETISHCTTLSEKPYSEYKLLELKTPTMSEQHNEYYSNESPSAFNQQARFTGQNSQFPTVHSDSSYSSNESLIHYSTDCNSNTLTANDSSHSVMPHPLVQTSCSVEFPSCSSLYGVENFPRVKIIDENFKERVNNKERSDYRVRLDKNYMEERNFVLGITPGIFYNTHHGILVEMKNGDQYEINLANNNSEACDVDLFVDMELVYRIRLEAYTRSSPIDGPQNKTKKFVFLRAFDAPPEANIIKNHERNGQIKAIFKPKMDDTLEKRRAWSADSVSCSQLLNQAICNITRSMQEPLIVSSPYSSQRTQELESHGYRSASFCSGATALQSRQREKCLKLAEDMKVDENKIVVLQLRLVARCDDQSQPSTTDPITPLITKMPPPLSF